MIGAILIIHGLNHLIFEFDITDSTGNRVGWSGQSWLLTKLLGNQAVRAFGRLLWAVAIFGFLGPNGAGKTATIRMLVGLTTPTEGTAIVNGYDIRKKIVEVKRHVGVVPETSNLYDELTVS